jgi:uncharacterized protein with PIN domain
VITRNRRLAGRPEAIVISAERLDAQLAELHDGPLGGAARAPGTRCVECNGLLVAMPRESARPLVPPYVFATQTEFHRCAGCGRVFWRGTHWEDLSGRLARAGWSLGASPDAEGGGRPHGAPSGP